MQKEIQIMSSNIDANKIDVSVKLVSGTSPMRAQASVTLDDKVEIKGWKIIDSPRFNHKLQEDLFISPPSYKYKGRYVNIVFINEPEIFDAIELKIYDEYCKKRGDQGGSSSTVADQVPF